MIGWKNKNTNGVCPCAHHEGDEWERVVVIPLDQWRRLVELASAWNSGDCCAAIADDMAGTIRWEAERGE